MQSTINHVKAPIRLPRFAMLFAVILGMVSMGAMRNTSSAPNPALKPDIIAAIASRF